MFRLRKCLKNFGDSWCFVFGKFKWVWRTPDVSSWKNFTRILRTDVVRLRNSLKGSWGFLVFYLQKNFKRILTTLGVLFRKSSKQPWGLLVFCFRKSLKKSSELLVFHSWKSLKESWMPVVFRFRKYLKESWGVLVFYFQKFQRILKEFQENLEGSSYFVFEKV